MTELMIDSLENRQLYAASVSFDAGTGLLTIKGSSGSDHIEMALYQGNQAQVVQRTTAGRTVLETVDLSSAKLVSFDGGAGDDFLSMGRVPLAVQANGGEGNDSLSGSRDDAGQADSLTGGDGNDYLFGGTGKDTLDGGAGYDLEYGYTGRDYLYALSDDNGDDTLVGGAGVDIADFSQYDHGVRLIVGTLGSQAAGRVDDVVFNDIGNIYTTVHDDHVFNTSSQGVTVVLRRGNDSFQGSAANELVFGGRGDDTINTVGGDDVVIDTVGTNTIDAGSGNNLVNPDDVAGATSGSTVLIPDLIDS